MEDAAGRYLNERVGIADFPACLRFAPDERYVETGSKPSWHPMLVAKADPSDAAIADGQRSALHRTYLDRLGGKAKVGSPRKMIGATSAAVRLMPHSEVLGIAEGMETAFSAALPCAGMGRPDCGAAAGLDTAGGGDDCVHLRRSR